MIDLFIAIPTTAVGSGNTKETLSTTSRCGERKLVHQSLHFNILGSGVCLVDDREQPDGALRRARRPGIFRLYSRGGLDSRRNPIVEVQEYLESIGSLADRTSDRMKPPEQIVMTKSFESRKSRATSPRPTLLSRWRNAVSWTRHAALTFLLLPSLVASAKAQTRLPDAISAPGEAVVLTMHAEGAQVYECKAGGDGKLAWAFREPIATLFSSGKTIGRHYAGPNWEHTDGSAVVGKVIAKAPGALEDDIAWLKLQVASSRGHGVLTGVTTVLRINTNGGNLEGVCDKAGSFNSAPYSADYVFLRKG